MRGFQDEVLGAVDERRLLLRVAAPQHEDDRRLARIDLADDRVGELLPAAVAVRGGAAHLDRQHAVEEKYALLRPMFEEAVAWPFDAEVALQLFVDILEARRGLHSAGYREA